MSLGLPRLEDKDPRLEDKDCTSKVEVGRSKVEREVRGFCLVYIAFDSTRASPHEITWVQLDLTIPPYAKRE